MKLLLDENLPQQLRLELPGHEVITVSSMGWKGVENGELLRSAAAASFDVLITNDRGLEYQQNLGSLPVAVLAPANTLEAIRPLIPAILSARAHLQLGGFVKVP